MHIFLSVIGRKTALESGSARFIGRRTSILSITGLKEMGLTQFFRSVGKI